MKGLALGLLGGSHRVTACLLHAGHHSAPEQQPHVGLSSSSNHSVFLEISLYSFGGVSSVSWFSSYHFTSVCPPWHLSDCHGSLSWGPRTQKLFSLYLKHPALTLFYNLHVFFFLLHLSLVGYSFFNIQCLTHRKTVTV